jgi:hypothetical protein
MILKYRFIKECNVMSLIGLLKYIVKFAAAPFFIGYVLYIFILKIREVVNNGF